jgi:hypothetical protein
MIEKVEYRDIFPAYDSSLFADRICSKSRIFFPCIIGLENIYYTYSPWATPLLVKTGDGSGVFYVLCIIVLRYPDDSGTRWW